MSLSLSRQRATRPPLCRISVLSHCGFPIFILFIKHYGSGAMSAHTNRLHIYYPPFNPLVRKETPQLAHVHSAGLNHARSRGK